MKKTKRIVSLVLALVMLFGVMPISAFAFPSSRGLERRNKKDGTDVPFVASSQESTVILACSDVQEPSNSYLFSTGDYTKQTQLFNNIIKQVKTVYPSVDGFFCGGDYNFDITREKSTYKQNGVIKTYTAEKAISTTLADANKVKTVITTAFPGMSSENITLIQGNHDQFCDALTPTGGYDKGSYSVYVINEKDYPSKNAVPAGTNAAAYYKKTAENLRAWLEKLTWEEYDKPVFVLSHVPLHFSGRVIRSGDAIYAKYLYDVLECYGNLLNIIFLYGHDHSGGDSDYLGGASVFLTKGDTLYIAQEGKQDKTAFLQKTLNFTYMNYGFCGYYWNQWDASNGTVNPNVDHALTMTTFEIQGNDVTIRRFDVNGQHVLKAEGGKSLGLNTNNDPLAPNTKIYNSPQTVKGPVIARTFENTETGVSVNAIGTNLSVTQKTDVPVLTEAGIKDFTAFDITVENFSGSAEVTMPAKDTYDTVWYVKDNGELEKIEGAVFNSGTVTFTTNHFSLYASGKAVVQGTGNESPLVDGAYYFVETPSSELRPGDQVVVLASDEWHIMYSQEDYYVFGDPLFDSSYEYSFLKDYSENPVQYNGKTYYLYNQTLQQNVEANGYLMTVTNGMGLKNCNNKYLNISTDWAEFKNSSAAVINANNTITNTINGKIYYLVFPGFEDEYGVYFSPSRSNSGSQLLFWRLEQYNAPTPVDPPTPPTPLDPVPGDDLSEYTKTAVATDTENYFDIKLNIKAPSKEVAPSIVILIDVSSSMDMQCSICGMEKTVHERTDWTCTHWDGTQTNPFTKTHDGIPNHSWTQRMPIAIASAKAFVQELYNSDTYDKCYVRLISFGGDVSYNSNTWVDVKTTAGYNAVKTAIENLTVLSGTNLASGMKASYDAFTEPAFPADCDPANSYLVLLSDGAANQKSTTDPETGELSQYHPCGDNEEGINPQYMNEWYNKWRTINHFEWPVLNENYNKRMYMGPVWYADQMHALGTKIFSVVLGNSMDNGAKERNNNYRYVAGIGLDNDDYIASFSDKKSHANTESELTSFYSSLVPTITTEVTNIVVTDPMADNIEFMYFVDARGNRISAPSGASFNSSTKTITWAPEDGFENTLYYRVRVQNENFTTTEETQNILTNGTTRAEYSVVVNGQTVRKYQDAVVPKVSTYEGTLEFDKIDQFGNKLSGVEFTLTLDGDCCDYDENYSENNHTWTASAVSDQNGHVTFTHIPSGHTFTMTETENPYLEEVPEINCGIKVSYGTTTKTGSDWDEGNIINEVPVFYVVHHAVHVNAEESKDEYYDDFVDIIPMHALNENNGVFDLTEPLEGYYDGIRNGYIYGGMYEGIRENASHDPFDDTVPENDYDTPDENGWCGQELTPDEWNYYYLREVSEEFLQPRIISVRRHSADEHVERYLLTAIDEDGADYGFYSEYGFIYDPNCDEEDIDYYMQSGIVETNATEEIYDDDVDEDGPEYDDMSCILYEYLDVYKNNVKQTTYEQTTVFTKSAGYSHITDDDYFGCVPYDKAFVEDKKNNCAGTKTAEGKDFTYNFHYTPYYVTSDGVFVSGIYERYTDISQAAITTAANNYDEKLASGSLTYCHHSGLFGTMKVAACFAANPDAIKEQTPEPIPETNDVTVTIHVEGETKTVTAEAGDFTGKVEAPEVTGKRFAGWYTDEDFTSAADFTDVQNSMDVYGRYICDAYFTVQMINTTSKKVITKTRIVTVVDAMKNYREVGFEVTVAGEKTVYTVTRDYASVNGYSPVRMFGENVDPHSKLIYQDIKLNGLANGTQIEIVPYYVTADGSRVYGNVRSVVYYADHMENIGG